MPAPERFEMKSPAQSPRPAAPAADAGSARRILIVETDPLLREILASGLELHNRRYRATAVADPAEAYTALAKTEYDLVLAGLDLPLAPELLRFLGLLRQVLPHLPLLLMTEEPPGTLSAAVPYDASVHRPPDMDELLAHADRLLRLSRQSVVRGISLASLLQVIQMERKTCTLQVSGGGRVGELGLRDGELVHARAGAETGREALFAILGWSSPVLTIEDRCDGPANLTGGVQELLLEYYIREDHQRR
jgi:DNA-binding response OmpR family regulator